MSDQRHSGSNDVASIGKRRHKPGGGCASEYDSAYECPDWHFYKDAEPEPSIEGLRADLEVCDSTLERQATELANAQATIRELAAHNSALTNELHARETEIGQLAKAHDELSRAEIATVAELRIILADLMRKKRIGATKKQRV